MSTFEINKSRSDSLNFKILNFNGLNILQKCYCVKSVQIRSFFWSVFSRIRTEYRAEKTSYLDNFQAVCLLPGNKNSSQNISFDFVLLL